MQAWSVAASIRRELVQLVLLPRIFLMLPDALHMYPACDNVVEVLCKIVYGINITTVHFKSDFGLVALELVVDVVRNRLQSRVNSTADPNSLGIKVESLSTSFRTSVMSLLNSSNSDDSMQERASLLLIRVKDIKNYSQALKRAATFMDEQESKALSSTTTLHVNSVNNVWNGWTTPNVGWLMSDSWHRVEDLKSVYTDVNDYANTLSRIWTLLTFYWGSGAVAPKCRCAQPGTENSCGEPLLSVSEGGQCCFRRLNGELCKNVASFRCHRRGLGHDAICMRCMTDRQVSLSICCLHSSSYFIVYVVNLNILYIRMLLWECKVPMQVLIFMMHL
jgi:hypothetical protein